MENLSKILDILSGKQLDIIVISSDVWYPGIADLCRNKAYYLTVYSTEDKEYFESIKRVVRGDWIAFLDGDCVPSIDWLSELKRSLSYNPYLLGGPINIKTNKDLEMSARTKWPIQLIHQVKLEYKNGIVTNTTSKMICSSNMVVSKDNFDRLNNDKVRIGYLGNGVRLDGNTYLIGNGLYFNSQMEVNCEIKG